MKHDDLKALLEAVESLADELSAGYNQIHVQATGSGSYILEYTFEKHVTLELSLMGLVWVLPEDSSEIFLTGNVGMRELLILQKFSNVPGSKFPTLGEAFRMILDKYFQDVSWEHFRFSKALHATLKEE